MSWSLSSDGKPGLVFVSVRSVVEEKEAKDSLTLARARAEEGNRVKTDFLSVMSHELRILLNPILGFAELLLADTEAGEKKEIL